MNPCKIWIEQCKAARDIEVEFGTQKALAYLVGEKFLNFLEAAERIRRFKPSFRPSLMKSSASSSRGNLWNAWRKHG